MHNNTIVEHITHQPHIPDNHPDTLGRPIIVNDLAATELTVAADRTADKIEWRNRLTESKDHPSDLTKKERFLGKLGMGDRPIMTREEVRILEDIDNLDGNLVQKTREMADKKKELVMAQIPSLRKTISALRNNDALTRLEIELTIIDSMSGFQFGQFDARFKENKDLSVIDWLTENPAVDMPDTTVEQKKAKELQQANDDQRILNFLQAHNHYMAERQRSPGFKEVVEKDKMLWSDGVERGVREGWLHERATEQIARLRGVQIYEGDFFSTALHGLGGYVRFSEEDIVAVARDHSAEVVIHELNHSLLQVLPEARYMLMHKTWLFEAITEEISLTITGDQLGEFNLEHGAYVEERTLLRDFIAVAQLQGADVSLVDFTRAYSAPNKEQYEIIENLQKRIHDAGFPDMRLLEYVDKLMQNALDIIENNPKENQLSERDKQKLATNRVSEEVRSWSGGIARDKKKAIS